jgi:hypothetical protein
MSKTNLAGTYYDRNFVLNGTPQDPTDLDYDILGLHKKRTFDKGLLTKVEYFKTYDGVTYADLAVQEDRVYTVMAGTDLVQKREMMISWLFEDATVGTTKATVKYYAPQEQIAEGKQRRGNVIELATLFMISKVGIPDGQDFLRSCASLVALYIAGSRGELIAYVTGATQAYMLADPATIPTLIVILDYPI